VATHVVGFDRFVEYVLGKEDGVPKTPEWASPKCGVPEWTIKALAREFASKTTSVAHYFGGGMIRGPYSHEPARLEVCLLGMQGLGKPGVHQGIVPFGGMPRSITDELAKFQSAFHKEADEDKGKAAAEYYGSWKAEDPIARRHTTMTSLIAKQMIPKTLIQDAIEKPPVTVWGSGAINAPVEDQFVKYTYPIPEAEGGSEIHMMWMDNPCRTTCWNDGNATIAAMRNPKIECVVAQHPWLENDCLLADIILPSNTTFEVDDIVPNVRQGLQLASVSLQKKAIEPVGESKSDYEVVLEIAKVLGLYEKVTGGLSIDDEIRGMFERMGFSKLISWEDLNDKQYVMVPTAKDWRTEPAGLLQFYEDPEAHPLPTPTGKLEFYSERLAQHFPDDVERQALPKWVEKGISHDERISGERAEEYPLLVMSNHGRWRMHSQCDDIPWTREAPTCKVQGWDGYMYEPLWINPRDAAQRDIESGDIVKVFNERGIVLGGAYVTERLMPGVLYMDHGARTDTIAAEPNEYIDRGGAINLITPRATTSKNCAGQATSGFLAEVAKVQLTEMQAWKEKYPEAFAREYDPARGLGFDAWVEGGVQ
jgi:anaerobic selenocysteine-containing dehydrogenase